MIIVVYDNWVRFISDGLNTPDVWDAMNKLAKSSVLFTDMYVIEETPGVYVDIFRSDVELPNGLKNGRHELAQAILKCRATEPSKNERNPDGSVKRQFVLRS
jgi:hypothetical protein